MTHYDYGFLTKCAAYRIPEPVAYQMLKQAQVTGPNSYGTPDVGSRSNYPNPTPTTHTNTQGASLNRQTSSRFTDMDTNQLRSYWQKGTPQQRRDAMRAINVDEATFKNATPSQREQYIRNALNQRQNQILNSKTDDNGWVDLGNGAKTDQATYNRMQRQRDMDAASYRSLSPEQITQNRMNARANALAANHAYQMRRAQGYPSTMPRNSRGNPQIIGLNGQLASTQLRGPNGVRRIPN